MLRSVMRSSRLLAIAAAMEMLTGCGSSGATGAVISMNSSACGGTWQDSTPGWHTFELYNANTVGGEVDLTDPATGGFTRR